MKRQLLTSRLSQRSGSQSSGTIVDNATIPDDVTLPDDGTIVDSVSLASPPPKRRHIEESPPPSYASVKTLKWSPGDPIPLGGFEPPRRSEMEALRMGMEDYNIGGGFGCGLRTKSQKQTARKTLRQKLKALKKTPVVGEGLEEDERHYDWAVKRFDETVMNDNPERDEFFWYNKRAKTWVKFASSKKKLLDYMKRSDSNIKIQKYDLRALNEMLDEAEEHFRYLLHHAPSSKKKEATLRSNYVQTLMDVLNELIENY